MLALRVTAFDRPAVLAEVPAPLPGPGEVGLRILACGSWPAASISRTC